MYNYIFINFILLLHYDLHIRANTLNYNISRQFPLLKFEIFIFIFKLTLKIARSLMKYLSEKLMLKLFSSLKKLSILYFKVELKKEQHTSTNFSKNSNLCISSFNNHTKICSVSN